VHQNLNTTNLEMEGQGLVLQEELGIESTRTDMFGENKSKSLTFLFDYRK
jgi:hypothetical protein